MKPAPHVVRSISLAAKGRPAHNHGALVKLLGVRQVGIDAWKLLDDESSGLAGETVSKERLQLGAVQLFSGPNGIWLITIIGHLGCQLRLSIGHQRLHVFAARSSQGLRASAPSGAI